MKFIKAFDDRHAPGPTSYEDISLYIREEVKIGTAKPFPIEHALYKSGDYTCSSFKISNRDVIVSSVVIDDVETKCVDCGKNYKTLSDCLKQFGLKSDRYLFVGFGEHSNGEYNTDKNVNDNNTLFRKMSTIIEIIKSMATHHNTNHIIFHSVENDTGSGLNLDYNKRDKFYELFLEYKKIRFNKIKSKIDIGGEIISNFYLLKIKNNV